MKSVSIGSFMEKRHDPMSELRPEVPSVNQLVLCFKFWCRQREQH